MRGFLQNERNNLDIFEIVIVADVPDAEAHFHAHEFLDATVQPKPIYISPNEVYAMHSLLSQNLDDVVRVIQNHIV